MVERRSAGEWTIERVVRHCQEEHADLQATLEASQRAEGRFQVPNEFGVVYVAADRATALAELDHRAYARTPVTGPLQRVVELAK